MPRPKSFLHKLVVDKAKRAHDCQHVPSHRIQCGQNRLKLVVDRTEEHFCIECAQKILSSDIDKLQGIEKLLVNS